MDDGQVAPRGFHVMVKPIGPICNLDCEYCYYLHKEELYPSGESWRMPEETLETYIRQYIVAQPIGIDEITFAWQGGEPTLLGIAFFERVVQFQQKYAPTGTRIANALQTNGVLVDDDWCRLFVEHGFLVGLSIDGPAELHDRYRYDKQGRPSFPAVMRCLKLFKQHKVEFNALVVVNRVNGDHGRKVYTYLRDNGVRFLQFIPIVERFGTGAHAEPAASNSGMMDDTAADADGDADGDGDGDGDRDAVVSSRSVLAEQFGDFLIDVFHEWIKRDVGRVFVQIFDQALSAWMGVEPSLCVFRKRCGRALAMEHNGDVFSCDHFVEPEYKLGNIHELPIVELANLPQQVQFGNDKETTLPRYCRECEVRFVCNGECPKNRFINTPAGEPGLNFLCAGYRKFFNHIDPYMRMMADELRQQRPAANVMHRLQEERRKKRRPANGVPQTSESVRGRGATKSIGRNTPCPCGSGRKYKKCCAKGD